jgi:DNA-binding NarL/FixJ family response regulator
LYSLLVPVPIRLIGLGRVPSLRPGFAITRGTLAGAGAFLIYYVGVNSKEAFVDIARQEALIADPDDYFRMALETILKTRLGFSDVHHVTSLDEAYDRLTKQPDIALSLFELNLPGVSGPTSLTAVRDCFPDVQVAVVSTSARRHDVLMTLDAGMHGYVPKTVSPAELTAALKLIVGGIIYVPPFISTTSSLVLEGPVLNAKSAKTAAPDTLTPRQWEVLELVVKGKSNKEIARTLNLGEGTIKAHMAGLFRTLGVNTRAAAAVAGTHLSNDWYSGA